MRAVFDLLEYPWIPVKDKNGELEVLGIRETLRRAHELVEIPVSSPLEEYSLYRFLALFLMDALRPEEEIDLVELWETGKFDMTMIETYISACMREGVSFDLFDEKRPFLQTVFTDEAERVRKPVEVLDCTLPSGNNHTHFRHYGQSAVSPGKAARLLLVSYWFCTAGAQNYPSGVYGAPPFFGVIMGDNLFESLVNSLIPTDHIGIPFDSPPVLWRRKKQIVAKAKIGSTSWLEGMLFPTRRICLLPGGDGNVSGVFYTQGENFVNIDSWRDPYVTYRNTDKAVVPLRPNSHSPLWRNMRDIIDVPGDHASQLLQLYRNLHENRSIRLTLYGVETHQASYLGIQRKDFTIPRILTESDAVDLVEYCVRAATDLTSDLKHSLSDIITMFDALIVDTIRSFDTSCENAFWAVCRSAGDDNSAKRELYCDYCRIIAAAVIDAFDNAIAVVGLRAHALAAAEEKRGYLLIKTKKMLKEGLAI